MPSVESTPEVVMLREMEGNLSNLSTRSPFLSFLAKWENHIGTKESALSKSYVKGTLSVEGHIVLHCA